MNMKTQIEIAEDLLGKFKIVDPFAMLAGGAVRDWRMNIEAKDLDIYLRLPNHNTEILREYLLDSVGIKSLSKMEKSTGNNYAKLPNLEYVYAGTYQDMPVNIMVMAKGVYEEVTKDFDIALCQCYYDGQNYHYSVDFETAITTGFVLVHSKYNGKEPHMKKMMDRFPQFKFVKEVAREQVDIQDYMSATAEKNVEDFLAKVLGID